jgi:hypothetical protein
VIHVCNIDVEALDIELFMSHIFKVSWGISDTYGWLMNHPGKPDFGIAHI